MKLFALILFAISSAWCAPAKVNPSAELHKDAQIKLDIGGADSDHPVNHLHSEDNAEEERHDDGSYDQANPYIESSVNSMTIKKNLSEKPITIGGLSVSGNLAGGRILYGSHIVIGPGGPNATSIDKRVLIEGEYEEPEHAEKVAEPIRERDYERKLQQLFSSMDLNKDGFLATPELLLACRQVGLHLKEAKAELMLDHSGDTAGFDYAMFYRVLEHAPSVITKDLLHFWIHAARAAQPTNVSHGDADKSNVAHGDMDESNVSHGDVYESYPNYSRVYNRRMRSVFLSLDKNHDGKLFASELVVAFRDMGSEIDEHAARDLLGNRENFDDGGLDFDEWKELLHQLPDNSKVKGSVHYWREAFAFYEGR